MTTRSKGVKMVRGMVYSLALAVLLSSAGAASAGLVYSETFDTDTTTTAQTLATYAAFSFFGGTMREVRVTNGVVHLPPQGSVLLQELVLAGFPGDLIIEVDLGKNPGGADFNVGLLIGDNRLLFHPGLSAGVFPQGSFRVEGPGGFPNEDMGFVPAGGDVLHHMYVAVVAATGQFAIAVTDADNPSNVYQASFTNPNYMPGDPIGFVTHGLLGTGERFARFDNLTVVSSVPEPSTFTLLGFGSLSIFGYVLWKRRLRRSGVVDA